MSPKGEIAFSANESRKFIYSQPINESWDRNNNDSERSIHEEYPPLYRESCTINNISNKWSNAVKNLRDLENQWQRILG